MPPKITELGGDGRFVWGTKFLFLGDCSLERVTEIQDQSATHVVDFTGHYFWHPAGYLLSTGSTGLVPYDVLVPIDIGVRLVGFRCSVSAAADPGETFSASDSRGADLCAIGWLAAPPPN